MVAEQNSPKPDSKKFSLEYTISILILAVIIFVGIGILIEQSKYDLKKYGLIPEKENTVKNVEMTEKIDTDIIAPAGFSSFSKPFEYNSQTLYEKINGKAPMYLSSGFRRLFTRRYMSVKDNQSWIEIYLYDMGTVKNAFSVYSRQMRTGASLAENIQYSYTTENAEIMVRDKYYIEIIGSKVDPDLKIAVSGAAMNIRAQIGPGAEIPELLLLNDVDLVKGSEKYYIRGAFGFEEFENVFSARYRFEGEKVTVFISGPFSRQRLENLISGYRAFLINEGSRDEKNNSLIPGLILLDFDGYFYVMFRYGEYMVGVHEADSKELALKLSEKLADILKRNSGEKNK